ncbi:hypothetical protein [Vandammella animalimorsus]|uniref:hypothetical protein n=1 Tax=Vandammella animalimorsus TaxID=2029117 RepID=UPI001177F275|nr:hypothetical protein [Vandammella animalimorsus]
MTTINEPRQGTMNSGLIQAEVARLSSTANTLGGNMLSAQAAAEKRVDLSAVHRSGPFDASPIMDAPSAAAIYAKG